MTNRPGANLSLPVAEIVVNIKKVRESIILITHISLRHSVYIVKSSFCKLKGELCRILVYWEPPFKTEIENE